MAYLAYGQMAGLNRTRASVPQFLFRTYSDESRGDNSEDEMRPDTRRCHATVQQIACYLAKDMVEQHLLYNYRHPSEFISWSSSLLFVLLHAIRKQNFLQEHNVYVCIMDTRKIHKTPIYPLTDLCRLFGLPNEGKTRHRNLVHEYLAHGPLKNTGCYSVVALDALIERGLFQSFLELHYEETDLAIQVWQVRRCFFARKAEALNVEDIKCLGRCFGKQFAWPATLAFMSLKRFTLPADKVTVALIPALLSMTIPHSLLDDREWNDEHSSVDEKELLEVTQFRQLMRCFCQQLLDEGKAHMRARRT